MSVQRSLFIVFLFFAAAMKVHGYAPGDTTITINAVGGLQFDVVRFAVKPGAKVKIILTNKDDMSHNLVVTKPGARMEVVNAADKLGNDGQKMNFVPGTPQVLWSIPVLAPGETKTIAFTAPVNQGVYPYVCTYPGHGTIMFGAMYVTDKGMPDIKEDPNVPSERRKHQNHSAAKKPSHPYKEDPPFMYRIFIPDAGPAAIAVNLPQKLSYCWDAGACRLRYAWQGDFLDNTDIWRGHRDAYGKILGDIFYRDKMVFPLAIDKPGNVPTVKFKGYRMIKRYPEFHYTMDGIEVYEMIKSKSDGTGLTRTFRVPKTDRIIWFVFGEGDGVTYQSSGGKWINDKLMLLPEEARQFTITMTMAKL